MPGPAGRNRAGTTVPPRAGTGWNGAPAVSSRGLLTAARVAHLPPGRALGPRAPARPTFLGGGLQAHAYKTLRTR